MSVFKKWKHQRGYPFFIESLSVRSLLLLLHNIIMELLDIGRLWNVESIEIIRIKFANLPFCRPDYRSISFKKGSGSEIP